MNASIPTAGYSSMVRLELVVGDQTLELGQIGPDLIHVRTPVSLPPCDADVVMHIDGRERRWPVRLPDGISSHSRLVRTEPMPTGVPKN